MPPINLKNFNSHIMEEILLLEERRDLAMSLMDYHNKRAARFRQMIKWEGNSEIRFVYQNSAISHEQMAQVLQRSYNSACAELASYGTPLTNQKPL